MMWAAAAAASPFSSSREQRARPRGRLLLPWTTLALLCAAMLIAVLPQPAAAVRPGDFKKCKDSSFCRRIRRLSSYVEAPDAAIHASERDAASTGAAAGAGDFVSPYYITPASTSFDAKRSLLTASVKSALHPHIDFALEVLLYNDGTSRIRMDEAGPRYGGWKRYNEAAKWAIDQQPVLAEAGTIDVHTTEQETVVKFGPGGSNSLQLTHQPIKAVFSRNGEPQVVLNERGLLHMEHYRPKPDPFPTPKGEGDDEEASQKLVFQNRKRSYEEAGHKADWANVWSGFEQEDSGEWEESFNGKTDSKPKGPEAFSLDIEFPGKSYAFGLPEHASPLNLRSTRGQKDGDFEEPYRLMNTDVFEYDYDSPMSLYGSVPVLHAQGPKSAASILWLAASETWIDIDRKDADPASKSTTRAHFFSESGILDLWIFLKDTPSQNLATFSELVGRTPLPAYFAIGYHQCRWNYLTTDDVLTVNRRFSEEDIPMDVIWLDIEYAKNHWYGVWNEETFPKPERMLEGLDAESRKLVIIVDPHFARNDEYFLFKDAKKEDIFCKAPDNQTDYEGWCWSGSASWVDNLNPAFWSWWVKQFSLSGKKIKANARNMHFWLDMNEPAIFNGPEITAPKDIKHFGGWEHRDIHNLYSVAYHNASTNAVRQRETPNHRPFTLARGWWIGTQKAGAIWTGDNLGTWEHLAVSVPMILANNIGGMSFCGADIGGFFGNPENDFLVRWYQAGIFEPFFRAHAHIDTKRREPYLLPEPLKSAVRDLIKLRYKMLPMWYTAFKESNVGGLPVLRPQFLMFPDDPNGYGIDDQYYVGDSGLLVRPAVEKDVTTVDVYLAEEKPYYNYFSHDVYYGAAGGKKVSVPAPLTGEVPLLRRGGSILPSRERVRRSAELGWRDPFTLTIALGAPLVDAAPGSGGKALRATGRLYLDDGDTYAHEAGDYAWRQFDWLSRVAGGGSSHVLQARDVLQQSADPSSPSSSSGIAVRGIPPQGGGFLDAIRDTVRVERIVVLGLDKAPTAVYAVDGTATTTRRPLPFEWHGGVSAAGASKIPGASRRASRLVVKDPAVFVAHDWTIEFE